MVCRKSGESPSIAISMEAFYKCYPKRSPKLLLDVVTKRDLY
ncbi:MAG: hypothetical protein ACJAW0_001303 [Zhongshania sp.]|jgi:hypothetical protein